jgi:hypothetical protein
MRQNGPYADFYTPPVKTGFVSNVVKPNAMSAACVPVLSVLERIDIFIKK